MNRLGAVSFVAIFLLACSMPSQDPGMDEFEGAAPLHPAPSDGKSDGFGKVGPPVLPRNIETRAWEVKNQWEDKHTPAALAAGMAWPQDSGLNWDQKFSRWVASFQQIDVYKSSWGKTYELTTPWGKSLPAPTIDCADQAILLRATFAAWYNLPFYMEAYDWQLRQRVYYSHAGIRTDSGRWGSAPLFRSWYKDYSQMSAEEIEQKGWPQDARLRSRGVIDKDDQPFISETARTGAYLDEIHLNKRAAHFIRLLLIYVGTPNLADGRNTYNLKPSALREGDTLLFRRARNGSGHTMVVLRLEKNAADEAMVEVASGNVPPRQPTWSGPASSKSEFTSDEGGGPSMNSLGEVYSHLGGGLKRFRVAKLDGDRWKNTFMNDDIDHWIDDRDYDAIAARPAQFDELLSEPSPEEKRESLLLVIETARRHLRNYPASCSARITRERAFFDLYIVQEYKFNISWEETDRQYRMKEDYVFAELEYEQSKTCCWNSSNSIMFHLIMDYVEQFERNSTKCTPPPVFKAVDGGYEVFARYAAASGNAPSWAPWAADETCPQAGVAEGREAFTYWTDYCELGLWSGTAPEPERDRDSGA